MNLLESARRLAEVEPRRFSEMYATWVCLYCGAIRESDDPDHPAAEHGTTCAWLSMPRIVAALEAAERVVVVAGDDDQDEDALLALADALSGRDL